MQSLSMEFLEKQSEPTQIVSLDILIVYQLILSTNIKFVQRCLPTGTLNRVTHRNRRLRAHSKLVILHFDLTANNGFAAL